MSEAKPDVVAEDETTATPVSASKSEAALEHDNDAHYNEENYPELNKGQREALREGNLPREMVLQFVTLAVASLALLLAVVSIVIQTV